MQPLPDGAYDVMIIDVDVDQQQQLHVDAVVTTGAQRGEVVSLRASTMPEDPFGLMGLPARLQVTDGVPRLEMD